MSSGAIRAGSAYIEIFCNDTRAQQTLDRMQQKMSSMGSAMQRFGTQMAIGGVMMGAPIAQAVRQFAAFDDVMRNMQASTGITTDQLKRVQDAANAMSSDLGVGPKEIATTFTELLKAGMTVEQVLGGAGRAAVQFAKVSGMDVAQSSVVMADAMNVFGVSAETAANTISAAADSSSTDITGMALAFSQVSAVAGLANQSIEDTSAALAILANAGVKGSDAGTSLKTMLMRLMAPADDAVKALDSIGLSVDSFRGADGKMLPLARVIGVLNRAMAGMGQTQKDDVFRRIFGQDAIRAAAVLSKVGTEGFGKMREGMTQANTVGQKFETLMGGLTGAATRVAASLEKVQNTVGTILAPALKYVARLITAVGGAFDHMLQNYPGLVKGMAAVAGGLLGVGVAAIVGGMGMKTISSAISVIKLGFMALPMIISPVGLTIMGVAAAIGIAVAAARGLSPAFKKQTDEIIAQWRGVNKEAQGAMGKGPKAPGGKGAADDMKSPADMKKALEDELAKAQSEWKSEVARIDGQLEGELAGLKRPEVTMPEPEKPAEPKAEEHHEPKAAETKSYQAADIGRTSGTFGGAESIGIGPELQRRLAEGAAAAVASGASGGAEKAGDTVRRAEGGRSISDRMATAFEGLMKAMAEQTSATKAGNQTLIKIADKLDGIGGAFV
jgi:TP901 family phage tail tape measure protein